MNRFFLLLVAGLMKAYLFRVTLIALFLTVCAFSCEKDNMEKYAPDCKTGNCVSVNIRGALRVKPSGAGLNNVPVDVYFSNSHLFKVPIFPTQRKVTTGKTNKNGEFDFKVTIDTKTFEDFRLIVKIPEQNNYIAVSENIRSFGGINEEAMQNINFVFYNKTILTINLNRTQADDVEILYIHQFFDRRIHAGNFMHILSAAELETTKIVQHETAAEVYTTISWRKLLKNGEQQNQIDSLICKPNSSNIFNINY